MINIYDRFFTTSPRDHFEKKIRKSKNVKKLHPKIILVLININKDTCYTRRRRRG